MLEDYVAFYLQKYLGKYVKGVSKEALKISAWQGNVELKNMQLKPEALLDLNLPVKVKAGFLGSVKLKVPWSRLGTEPVIVELDRIFVLAEPSLKVEGADDEVVQEARYQAIKEAETKLLESMGDQHKGQPEMNNSWIGSLIGTIISNIKISVTNIHIRYEDTESNPGHPFAVGFTLEKLAAVTVDENGKEIFVSGDALDGINKSGELKRLAVYFDSNTEPWNVDWEKLTPADWSKTFEPGIRVEVDDKKQRERHFLLQPVDGISSYNKLGMHEQRDPDKPAQTATVILESVTLCLSEAQYRDTLKLIDNISAFRTRVEYAHLKPRASVRENPRDWWRYAVQATIEQIRKSSGKLKWDQVLHYARLRKKYVALYAKRLLENPGVTSITDDVEIRKHDRQLDKDVIVQWRILAHTLADQARAQTSEREKEQQKKSWWPLGWGGQPGNGDTQPRNLSDEEWKQLNDAIGYEEGKYSSLLPGQDPPNMLHTILNVKMRYNATKLLSDNEDILDLSCEVLETEVKLYSSAKEFALKLQSYKIRVPEGVLGKSASEVDALKAHFCYQPVGENLDWSLSATASPCYVTYYKASVDRVASFFRNKSAVSREVALQTAAALQMTLDDVARKAQSQLNEAMKDKPRFSLFLDIAAPKITVPTEFYPKHQQRTQLMLDLGHFTMKTETAEEQGLSGEEKDLYLCFKMQLKDVSAFVVDGHCDWDSVHTLEANSGVLQVIHRCGIIAAVQQICAPHPLYPNTRVAARVPSLGMDFSPSIYHRLMQVAKIFQDTSSDDTIRPWDPADCEGELSVLSWKGIGNREAVWKRRYGALAGPFMYILESKSSTAYEHCASLIGKQVYSVPPEAVGGIENVLAICDPIQFSKKIVESVNALLLRFDDEESLSSWRTHLTAAIHKLASSQAVARANAIKESPEEHSPTMREKEIIFLSGALDELKLCISSTKQGRTKPEEILLDEETPLLELRAVGNKVEFVMRQNDMGVGAAMLSLEIEDKWQCAASSSRRYLARSTIPTKQDEDEDQSKDLRRLSERSSSGSERFFDSSPSFGQDELSDNEFQLSRRSSSQYYDVNTAFDETRQTPLFERTPGLLPNLHESRLTKEQDRSERNFIKAQVVLSSPEAPHYANIDKQVKLSLATLAFYFNRPTLVGILNFVSAINVDVGEPHDEPEPSDEPKDVTSVITPADVYDSKPVPVFDRKDSVVKGLLGTGKSRVLFLLVLDMDRAQVILNRDDGAPFATLSQEDLHATVKIFPATYAISATLGNLRITDDRLDQSHPYFWLCDMRDPAGQSFVELEFISYNEDDDDYEGYEFSLSGRLSEVRVVYLHRFIQEISAYFMGLVPPNSDYAVKLKDRVTDAEKVFNQSEVEGAPALKLDMSLSRPVIIFPKDTNSKSFLELDILHIHVSNTFEWLGGGKDDIGAVRLETDALKVENLHLMVGVNGKTGSNIIKESSGIFLVVRRTLRDLQHQLPAVDAAVELVVLKAALSDTEYQVMIDCFLGNLQETPDLPPPLPVNGDDKQVKGKEVSPEEDTGSPSRDNTETETLRRRDSCDKVWTTLNLTVDIALVQLQLYVGRMKESPLASIQVTGVWAGIKMSTNQEQYIMLSLDSVSVTDDREGIEPDLRFMIGKANDGTPLTDSKLRSVMLVLDAKMVPGSQMITLRLQRPRVLLALDFLLAVAEFFIPSIADMLPNAKSTSEIPYDMKNWIFMDKTPYIQNSEEVRLSPKRVLVADNERIEKYVYEGRGGRICLTNAAGDDVPSQLEGPSIIVGDGKSLHFRNVIIQNAEYLDGCIFLGSNSSYSICENDGVFLERDRTPDGDSKQPDKAAGKDEGGNSTTETTFDLQAVGPELVMYAASSQSSKVKDRLICAKMDLFSRVTMKGDDLEVNGKINGLVIEGHGALYVLEPIDSQFTYSKVSSRQNVHFSISDVVCNLTFTTIQLVLKLQEDAQSFLLLTSKKMTVECMEFDKIWADKERSGCSQIAIWRPRVPPGFAVLGDCLTVVDEPPSNKVLALNMNLAHVRKPEGFDFMWSSNSAGEGCSVWLPKAPAGYVALGCVARLGNDPPDTSSVLCVAKHLVTQWYMKDCIYVRDESEQEWAFWRASNSTGSFFHRSALVHPFECQPYELRHVMLERESPSKDVIPAAPTETGIPESLDEPTKLLFATTTRFKLIWWDKGAKSRRSISIWRPAVPAGCAIFGDLIVEGYEPPGLAVIPLQAENTLLQKPLKFIKMGHIQAKGLKALTFWLPVSPPGYVVLGCLACQGPSLDEDAAENIRCVRNDLVVATQLPSSSIWDTRQVRRSNQDLSIWPLQVVDNETKASTFLVNITQEPPPKTLAFELKELGSCSNSDSLAGDAEIGQFSATVFDDFGGMMIPLLKVSLNGITTSLHGSADSMKLTTNFVIMANTYNGRCDAWEPIIERADGYMRYTNETLALSSSSVSQISVAVTSDLNINISTGNLNLLLGAYESWNKLQTIEMSMKEDHFQHGAENQILKQEQEKKLQVTCFNDLGQDLFSRLLDENCRVKVVTVHPRETRTFRMPNMAMLRNPTARKRGSLRTAKIVSLAVGEAQLPRDKFGGRQQYMVAVRVVPQLQTADHHHLQYQSARTRCINPSDQAENGSVIVSWNEVFFLELDLRHTYTIEFVVTDLGKGASVGYCSFSMNDERDMEKHPLNASPEDQGHSIGWLSTSHKFLYEDGDTEHESLCDAAQHNMDDGSIQVSLSPNGPWSKLHLNATPKCSYLKLGDDVAASESTMEGGSKHFTIRSPVVVENSSTVKMEVSLIPQSWTRQKSTGDQQITSSMNSVEEEVFENERLQPLVGWGSSWPGHLLPTDPGRWSKKDFSSSTQEFPPVELPLGWEWSSDWFIDLRPEADSDGWAYAFAFKSLADFPFRSSSKKFSFVRRRRWARARHRTSFIENARCIVAEELQPSDRIAIPLACFRETRQDYLLQLKPVTDHPEGGENTWTQVVLSRGQGQKKVPIQEINVRTLFNERVLSSCLLEATGPGRSMWFCMDVNFTDIGRDVRAGLVKDCHLIVSAPLKIVNHLPVSAQYSVFCASRIRGFKMQAQSTVNSGGTAEVYHADIRKALYLSFIPEGPWQQEKDPVLISHPFREVGKSMLITNTSTKRTVRVHIEHDYEEEATSKVLRVSVPYWIDCSRCPPLLLRVMSIEVEPKCKCLPDSGIASPQVLDEISPDELENPFTIISPFIPQTSAMAASASRLGEFGEFGPPSLLADLDKVDGTVELMAFDGRSYYHLLVTTSLCPIKFAHTKVVTIRPYITYTNRFGTPLYITQGTPDESWDLRPSDWRKTFSVATVPSLNESPKLQIRLESSEWSSPVEIKHEETLHFYLRNFERKKVFIRMEIRGYQEGSRYVVVFRRGSFRGPFRLENRTQKQLRFRQVGTLDDDWELLYPLSTRSYAWKDPSGHQNLELRPENMEIGDSLRYDPEHCLGELSAWDLQILVLQLQEVKLLKICDQHHKDQHSAEEDKKVAPLKKTSQLKVILDVERLCFSIIDQRPQEILSLWMESFKFSVQYSSEENTARFKLRLGYLQLDDQNLLTFFPVIFAPETRDDCVFKSTLVMQNTSDEATKVYPHVGVWVMDKAWCVNVHEPIIWTCLAMYHSLNLGPLSGETEVVQVDPEIRLNLIDVSEARLKLTLKTEPSQRPRGMLGIWSPVLSLLGNTSKMQIHITGVTFENRYMRQSEVLNSILTHLRKDLVHQAFVLIFGVDVLGMASSTLETLSKTAAELSQDENFRQFRSKQDRLKHLSGVGDGLLRGGEALARGFAFGLSGVVTKPVSSARERGVCGFIQGIGKAAVGFVMQPISGVLDFIALTIDGVNISYTRCFEAFTHDRGLTRLRLPRAIRGDGVICTYDERAAVGQAMMQLAEGQSFGQNVVFREPAKFAMTDFYEDHFELPDNKVALITNRRVMLISRPSSYKELRNIGPSHPCRILWEVSFAELLALEVAKKTGSQLPVYVILHLRNDPRTFAQVIRCHAEEVDPGVSQAEQLLSSIQSRWRKYGPDKRELLFQMRKWQKSTSLPTPRASKRVPVSDEQRSKRDFDADANSGHLDVQSEKFVKEVILFDQIWKSEEEPSNCCSAFSSVGSESNKDACTIWRPVVSEGYVSVGDVVYQGTNGPTVTLSYRNRDGMFAQPTSFYLVWRNWRDSLLEPVSIWRPKPPDGYVALGCVAVAGYMEPEQSSAWCARRDIVTDALIVDHPVWKVSQPWRCFIYQVQGEALTFLASREEKTSEFRAHRVNIGESSRS